MPKQQNDSGTPAKSAPVKDKRNADRKNGKKWSRGHSKGTDGGNVRRVDYQKDWANGAVNAAGVKVPLLVGPPLPRSIVGYKRDKAAGVAMKLSLKDKLGYTMRDLDSTTIDGCKLIKSILTAERDRKKEKRQIEKALSGLRNINWTVAGRTRVAGV